jgi:DNA-binding NarL/FixJ family response regulator
MQRVVVIDQHRIFAELLSMVMAGEPDLECVGHAQTVSAGLALSEELRPDVVVIDERLGDGDGVEAAARLAARDPALRVLLLTARVDRSLLHRAAVAGACALVPKDGELTAMLQAVRTARRGSFMVHPELLRQLVASPDIPAPRTPPLTAREQSVLQLLAGGAEVRVIANELGISINTCRSHVKSLLSKMGAHSQLEAVAAATRHGLVRAHSNR